jgi:type I restriction enzyme, S subunit
MYPIRAKDGHFDRAFLFHLLLSEPFNKQAISFQDRTGIPKINRSQLASIILPRPPLSEQTKIAYVLSTVQRAIEQQDRIIALTTELKKGLMHKLFTEGLRGEPLKETEIGPVPESWELIPLGDVLTLAQYGLSLKGEEIGSYGLLRMTNQTDGRISPNNLQFVTIDDHVYKKFTVQKGDILFNRTNSRELVGRTAIFDIEGDYVFASYLIRLRTDTVRLNPFFLNQYLCAGETQTRLKSIATPSVSQSNISASRLRRFQIPLPSLMEQVGVVAISEVLDRKIYLHRRKKLTCEDLFRTLLHQLMTAQIRVNDLDIGELETEIME